MRPLNARFPSKCHECGKPINQGDPILYDPETKWAFHPECAPEEDESATPEQRGLADELGLE